MIKKLKIAYKELQANRGSGLAIVMIAMVLLSLMATTLLNMTYIGYKIKAEDRQQKNDYYVVSTAMDEIRAGMQEVISDKIETAYKSVLASNTYGINVLAPEGQAELERIFQEKFFDEIETWATNGAWPGTYKLTLLESMIGYQNSGEITINRYDNNGVVQNKVENIKVGGNTTEFILHNVSLTYKNSKNNTITVKADIVITSPGLNSDEWDFDKLVQYRNWTII